LAASTSKKVVVLRFDRGPLHGFVNPQTFQQAAGLELLTVSGEVQNLPYSEVKAICFVRDFETGPEWREHRTFISRPKTEGLWVRLYFRDGDTLDGILPKNLLLIEPLGFTIAPADPSFQSQRIYVPRAALRDTAVMGVIGAPVRRPRKPAPARPDQLEMFDT
jgi:hypothetical protein